MTNLTSLQYFAVFIGILKLLLLFQDQLRMANTTNTNSGNDSDKFEMYQALDKAEARIASLERQVNISLVFSNKC